MTENRKKLSDAFGEYLTNRIPSLNSKTKALWAADVGQDKTFYVFLDYPNPSRNGEILAIYYGTVDQSVKLQAITYYPDQKEVSFPYKLHRELFELFDQPHYRNVSFLRWYNTSYKRNLLYGNSQLTDYSISHLVPHAVGQIEKYYGKINNH